MAMKSSPPDPVLANLDGLLAELETIYKDIHSHPELSMQEERTAGVAADHLRAVGYEVTTGVGKTGVVGLLRNGEGPTVMLRADMDALPVQETTGLPYASKVTATDSAGKTVPVMHACGHDMHVTWLIGAAKLFAKSRDAWKGTLMPVFQPAEETARGAEAMIDDGLFKRFPEPEVILGQHVMCMPAGVIGGRIGVTTSAADSLQIKLFGRGAHGSSAVSRSAATMGGARHTAVNNSSRGRSMSASKRENRPIRNACSARGSPVRAAAASQNRARTNE
jgi:amidohydrolase